MRRLFIHNACLHNSPPWMNFDTSIDLDSRYRCYCYSCRSNPIWVELKFLPVEKKRSITDRNWTKVFSILLYAILADWICLIFRDLSNIIEQNWFNKFIHQNLVCFDRVYICQFKFPIIEIIKSHVLSLFVTKFAE